MITRLCVWSALLVLTASPNALAARQVEFPLRGRTLTLAVYRPPADVKGTIVMGSGDVGWVGLGPSMSDDLSSQGFVVIGINVRQYLASFTDGKRHLETRDIAEDFHALGEFLKGGGLLQRPVILSGVSEGAALAVVAAAYPPNHDWIDGVITMGLPPTAELAWRWADAASWVTGRDAGEPSFVVHEFLGAVSPLPLVMIQSTKDDYVTEADRQRFVRSAREPKRLVLIDARNHRFSGRHDELRARYVAGLDFIRAAGATK